MRLHLVAVGTRMPDWVDAGFGDYARRLRGGARLDLHEVPAARRRETAHADQARVDEARRLRAALPAGARVVALDAAGRTLDTPALARRLGEWRAHGTHVAFLVGGPDGLDPTLREEADECWSLSPMTFPHALVRVILAEQVYRALCILDNHPYHR